MKRSSLQILQIDLYQNQCKLTYIVRKRDEPVNLNSAQEEWAARGVVGSFHYWTARAKLHRWLLPQRGPRDLHGIEQTEPFQDRRIGLTDGWALKNAAPPEFLLIY